MHIEDILYVLGLKKNLLSVVGLEDKGYKVIFMDIKVLLWSKNEKLSSAELIGVREGGLYKAFGHSTQALVHNTSTHVSYGIEGLDTFIIQLSLVFKI